MRTLGRLSVWSVLCLTVGLGSLSACGGDDDSGAEAGPGNGGESGEGSSQAGTPSAAGSSNQDTGGAPDGAGGAPDTAGGAGGAPGDVIITPAMPDTAENQKKINAFINDLSAWPATDPPQVTADPPTTEDKLLGVDDPQVPGKKWPFTCTNVKHSVLENHEEILNLDSAAAYVKPGLILSGNQFVQGKLSPIPLPRAPITLSINVPKVATASVVVKNPTSASIQEGIAKLQTAADAAAAGNYPAQLAYEQQIVQSSEEMRYKLGITASYDGGFADAKFDAEFSSQSKQEQYTVASKLMQSMYTITFAQDEIANARDFFSPNMSLEQLLKAEADGFLGPDNPPVFIGSVTYGRMVVFTATSTAATTAQQFQTSIEAAGTTWSAGTTFEGDTTDYLSDLKYAVLAIGGDQGKVTGAIESGEWSELYGDADILSSVPLRYSVYALNGDRPIAAIADTTEFTTSECVPVEGWQPVPGPDGVVFTDVSTNPSNNPVVAVGRDGVNYRPYLFDGDKFVAHASMYQPNGFIDVAVDEPGNIFTYDNYYQIVGKMPSGTFGAWQYASDDNGVTGSSRGGHYDGFDAGAANTLISTYPDGSYLTFYSMTWNQPWTPLLGNAEGLEIGTGTAPFFSAVGNGWVGRLTDRVGLLYLPIGGGPGQELIGDQTYLNSYEHVSGATRSQIFAVKRGLHGSVVILNEAQKLFKDYAPPPPKASIKQLEASGNGHLWAVGDDDKIYKYLPSRVSNLP